MSGKLREAKPEAKNPNVYIGWGGVPMLQNRVFLHSPHEPSIVGGGRVGSPLTDPFTIFCGDSNDSTYFLYLWKLIPFFIIQPFI